MTRRKKIISLLGLMVVFIIIIPVLIFFSFGYRLDNRFRLVKTGGIYLTDIGADAAVLLNGKFVKRSSVLEKNILIRNLVPKTYYVRIEKDGYRPWKKNIKVQEEKVEVCYPLLLPFKLNPQFVQKYLVGAGEKKKRKPEINEEYEAAMNVFKKFNSPVKSIIPGWEGGDIKKYKLDANRRLYKKVFLFRHENQIFAKWTGTDDRKPFFIVSEKRPVYSPDKNILSFGFFPGRNDSMLVLLEDLNLYAVEIDTRFEIQNIYKVAQNCSSFSTGNEFLYYFSEKAVYRIDFEP